VIYIMNTFLTVINVASSLINMYDCKKMYLHSVIFLMSVITQSVSRGLDNRSFFLILRNGTQKDTSLSFLRANECCTCVKVNIRYDIKRCKEDYIDYIKNIRS
jgi:hypothetical protein